MKTESAMDEGFLKFTVHLTEGDVPACEEVIRLNEIRTELHDLGMIGAYPSGIGYGNLSVRFADSTQFIISGTTTGAKRVLSPADYCLVDGFDLATNEVFCTGRVRASAETMSHGVVYLARPEVNCVLHVHSRPLFDFMLATGYPRTSVQAAFGTPEIAREIAGLVRDAGQGVFVMTGHDEGVIAYGRDMEEARRLLLEAYGESAARK